MLARRRPRRLHTRQARRRSPPWRGQPHVTANKNVNAMQTAACQISAAAEENKSGAFPDTPQDAADRDARRPATWRRGGADMHAGPEGAAQSVAHDVTALSSDTVCVLGAGRARARRWWHGCGVVAAAPWQEAVRRVATRLPVVAAVPTGGSARAKPPSILIHNQAS